MSAKPAPKPRHPAFTWRLPKALVDRLKEYARKTEPRASIVAHIELAIKQYLDNNDR